MKFCSRTLSPHGDGFVDRGSESTRCDLSDGCQAVLGENRCVGSGRSLGPSYSYSLPCDGLGSMRFIVIKYSCVHARRGYGGSIRQKIGSNEARRPIKLHDLLKIKEVDFHPMILQDLSSKQ